MTALNNSSRPQHPNKLLYCFLAVSFIGFLDAAYLSAKYFVGSPVTCEFFTGCEAVTSSSYAEIFGIPIALVGALYYVFFIISTIYYLDSRSVFFFSIIRFTILGFLASLLLIAIQLFIIKALCLYCIVSAAASTLLFLLSLGILHRKNEYQS